MLGGNWRGGHNPVDGLTDILGLGAGCGCVYTWVVVVLISS